MKDRKDRKDRIVNVIRWIAYLAILGFSFYFGCGGGIPFSKEVDWSIPEGLTNLTIAFLGICTWFDISEAFWGDFFVPREIVEKRKQKTRNQVMEILDECYGKSSDRYKEAVSYVLDTYYGENFERYSELLEQYFRADSVFALACNERRIDYIMNQLGITKKDYDGILDELARLRSMPLRNKEDAVNRIKKALPKLIENKNIDIDDKAYRNVQYYVDFISIMRDDAYRRVIASAFAHYIRQSMKEELRKTTKIVIPADSNYLLGFKVGEILELPQIIIRKEGRINKKHCWDGNLQSRDRVIIVHDVLVSGDRIIDAIKRISGIYPGVEVMGVFCIVKRTDFDGEKNVKELYPKCRVECMLGQNDETLKQIYKKKNRKVVFAGEGCIGGLHE